MQSENELVEIVVGDDGREFRLLPARPYFQLFIALNCPAIVQPAGVGSREPGGTASKTNAPKPLAPVPFMSPSGHRTVPLNRSSRAHVPWGGWV